MKKILAICLVLFLCLTVTACAGQTTPETTQPSTETVPESTALPLPTTQQTLPVTYTYQVSSLQGALRCGYYPQGSSVPISYDPATLWGYIVVWPQCTNCGDESFEICRIDPAELNFAYGDTLQYSGTSSCYDCSWDHDIDQFMWVISVTRVPE